ncbi:histidine kinase [Flavobacterium sp. XN-5]|uniref:histidine kinase n=1 Tax=Flavobacterium sp. XN-5 TaxID=2599390 RepID=UPI0011C8ECCB|nr:histidine kinase [Flavobacterium sp. XN-5]NGY38994.1 histidine kinase [Flavobacterium sp. XN-5]
MKTGIRNYKEITKELKVNYPKLTEYEVLTLAIQIERNEILENGLVVSTNDKTPSGIEAISIALGYTDSEPRNTVANILTEIANKE